MGEGDVRILPLLSVHSAHHSSKLWDHVISEHQAKIPIYSGLKQDAILKEVREGAGSRAQWFHM
jgi:hypothetical protein